MDDKRKETSLRNPMGRREFLILSSVAMLTPLSARAGAGNLLSPAVEQDSEQALVASGRQAATLSIGYWQGGESLRAGKSLEEGFTEDANASGQQLAEPDSLSSSEQQAQPALPEVSVSEFLQGVQEGLSSRVVDAGSIHPDKTLQGRDVRVTIHNIAQAEAAGDRLTEWLLDAMYQVKTEEGVIEAPFHAWGYKDDQLSNSGSISFTAPVYPGGGLTFRSTRTVRQSEEMLLRLLSATLTGRGARTETCSTESCSLSVDASVSGPRLREGVYLIAGPSYRTGELPQWKQYEFHAEDGDDSDTARRLYRRTLTGLAAVDFDYVMVSVSAG